MVRRTGEAKSPACGHVIIQSLLPYGWPVKRLRPLLCPVNWAWTFGSPGLERGCASLRGIQSRAMTDRVESWIFGLSLQQRGSEPRQARSDRSKALVRAATRK